MSARHPALLRDVIYSSDADFPALEEARIFRQAGARNPHKRLTAAQDCRKSLLSSHFISSENPASFKPAIRSHHYARFRPQVVHC